MALKKAPSTQNKHQVDPRFQDTTKLSVSDRIDIFAELILERIIADKAQGKLRFISKK